MSDSEQRRRSAAALFLQVHDIDDPGAASRPAAVGDSDATRAALPSLPPVVRLCNLIIAEGLRAGGDELRINAPTAEGADVQLHRAESWLVIMRVPAPAQAPLINRLKVMANLDVGKRPLQQGTLKVRRGGEVFALAIEVRLRGDVEEASLRLPTHAAGPISSAPPAAT